MSNPQDRASKRCPCDRGRAFTDNLPGTHRNKEGAFICSYCAFEAVMADAIAGLHKND